MMNALAKEIVKKLTEAGKTLSVAESCTGGLMAKELTGVPGASSVFAGGFVTYTNEAKMKLLGVSAELIDRYTEVSRECAEAMAQGAAKVLGTDYALSATGYAGPGGGTKENPVGTVYLGIYSPKGVTSIRFFGKGEREEIRTAAAREALEALWNSL